MKNIHWVYALHSIKGLAGSFIGVFIPIYFLSLGFSVRQIFTFWLIYGLCLAVFSLIAALLSTKVGFKPIIICALILQFIVLYLLRVLTFNQFSLYILAVCVGLQAAFYWLPINYLFTIESDEKKMGDNTSKLMFIPKIFRLPVPLVSSVIVVTFGFNSLFMVSGFIYLLCLYPLYRLPDIRPQFGFKYSTFRNLYSRYRRYYWAEFLENIREEFEGIIIPIFVFLTIKSIISVGVISTLAPAGSILFTYLIGKISDSANKKYLIRFGAIVMIIVWLSRYLWPSSTVFYATTFIIGFIEVLVLIPFSSIIYTTAKKENTLEFLLFRESSVGAARIVVYLIAIILANNLLTTFLIPAAALGLFMIY